jgi:hypothetical protein
MISSKIKIFLGILVELSMFIPLSFLVMLFRKIKPPHKRSKKLEKILQSNDLDANNQKIKLSDQNENKKKSFVLPRSFKIVLYLVSFLSMVFSIAFTLFKGKFYTLLSFILN